MNRDEKETAEDRKAVDWLLAVRKYGLEEANKMFPTEDEA